jgi:cytochrome d ubiquinol oxidase subunit II
MAVVIFLAAYLTLVGSFWPYMIPFSVTVWDAAAPPQSLAFMFYGAGIVVFPVVLIYTVAVYWIFRGKVHDSLALSRQASTGHDVDAPLSRQ